MEPRTRKSVGLSDRLNRLPWELSGGQEYGYRPSTTEPTGILDHINVQAIYNLFDKIRKVQRTAALVVTHDFELTIMAERSINIRNGRMSK